jgi:hypothetical protein
MGTHSTTAMRSSCTGPTWAETTTWARTQPPRRCAPAAQDQHGQRRRDGHALNHSDALHPAVQGLAGCSSALRKTLIFVRAASRPFRGASNTTKKQRIVSSQRLLYDVLDDSAETHFDFCIDGNLTFVQPSIQLKPSFKVFAVMLIPTRCDLICSKPTTLQFPNKLSFQQQFPIDSISPNNLGIFYSDEMSKSTNNFIISKSTNNSI